MNQRELFSSCLHIRNSQIVVLIVVLSQKNDNMYQNEFKSIQIFVFALRDRDGCEVYQF